jgi:ATP-dependent DNA ligase
MKDRISERKCQGRLESLLKSDFNTELQPLRSLETANQKAESAEKEGRKKFWVHQIKHDGFRLMVRPARAFYEVTLVCG